MTETRNTRGILRGPDARAAEGGKTERPLTILRVNPLDHEAGLKELMTSNGVAAFGRSFDDGYASAVRDGARSWIGVDEHGALQMNVTLFVHQFQLDGHRVAGGMLGNMMVATEYRTFFPAVALLRQVVADARTQGELDFLYGDPGPKGAQAIFRGARMRLLGNLDRFVIPLRDERWHRSIGATAYATTLRLRNLRGAARAHVARARDCDAGATMRPLEAADGLHPLHSSGLFRRRLPGWPGPDDYVVELRRGAPESPPAAIGLLRGPEEWGIVTVHVLRRRADTPVKACVAALIGVARRLRGTRLQVETVEGSRLGRSLIEGGFTPRGDHVPIFGAAFTPLGESALDAFDRWELTGVDMER